MFYFKIKEGVLMSQSKKDYQKPFFVVNPAGSSEYNRLKALLETEESADELNEISQADIPD